MKYFVVSDIHSFYNELIKALDKAGYNMQDPDHTLIVCGDIFDRGKQSMEVFNFLSSIPKSRRILIRGNHEYLLRSILKKNFPQKHDYTNGTVRTICNMSGFSEIYLDYWDPSITTEELMRRWRILVKHFKQLKIIEWIFSDEWVNYYETENYIFVHCFIPLAKNNDEKIYYNCEPEDLSLIANWREKATKEQWEGATWGCPYKLIDAFPQEKTIVCGHWSSKDFFLHYNQQTVVNNNFCPIFYSQQIIGIDACTAATHEINVFTFEE